MLELGWIFTLIGVILGWFLTKRSGEKMSRVAEIRNELEKAYGILYSIVSSRPEEMVKVDGGDERRVVVSEEGKKEIDRILTSYPHMFPYEIVVLWRKQIKDLEFCRYTTPVDLGPGGHMPQAVPMYGIEKWFGIPLKFKDEITKEYEHRLEEYYKTTGRWKSIKDLPKWARA